MWFWLSWGKGGGVLLFGPLEVMGAAPWFSEVLLRGKQHRQSKKPQRKLQRGCTVKGFKGKQASRSSVIQIHSEPACWGQDPLSSVTSCKNWTSSSSWCEGMTEDYAEVEQLGQELEPIGDASAAGQGISLMRHHASSPHLRDLHIMHTLLPF